MSFVKFAVVAALAVSVPAMSFAQDAAPVDAKAAAQAEKDAAKAAKQAEKEAKAAAKAAEKAKENVDPVTGEVLICRRMEGVGGNIGGTKICKTKKQWEKSGA